MLLLREMLQDILIYTFIIVGAIVSFVKKKLTASGAVIAALVGYFVYAGGGLTGLVMLTTFFISGTLATQHQWKKKQQLLLTEKRTGARNAMQVIANGGIAAVLGMIILLLPAYKSSCVLMMAGSLASATSDTLASELGNVYGRKYFNILTFQKDQRGLDGVISVEGTLAGIAGSILISILYAIGYQWSNDIAMIIVAGICGNLFDSILGATLQRKSYLNNDMVNLLNTTFAALLVLIFR